MPFQFIAGSDDFLVQRRARTEWTELVLSVGDPNAVEIVEGQAGNVDEVNKCVANFVSAVRTISLFAQDKAVWLKDVSFLADSVTGRSKGTLEAVEHLQEVLANYDEQAVRILISASPVDRRKKAYKWFQANGKSIFLETGKDAGAVVVMVEEEAARTGVRFSGNAADILVQMTGGSARLALEETRKLVTYLGPDGGTIDPPLVAELVPSLGDSDFFEAAEAFYSLDLEWTLAAVHRHFFAGHDARGLISSLQNRNRLLLQIKAMMQTGRLRGRVSKESLEKAAADMGIDFGEAPAKSGFCIFTQNPWYLGRLADSLNKLSLRALLDFQEAFCDAFMEIIRRPTEQEAVITAMAVRCISPLIAASP